MSAENWPITNTHCLKQPNDSASDEMCKTVTLQASAVGTGTYLFVRDVFRVRLPGGLDDSYGVGACV